MITRQNGTLANLYIDARNGTLYLNDGVPPTAPDIIPCPGGPGSKENQQTQLFPAAGPVDLEALLGTDKSQGGNWFSLGWAMEGGRVGGTQRDFRICDSEDLDSRCLDPAPTPNATLVVTYTLPPPVVMETFDAGADATLATPSEEDGYMEAVAASGAACGAGDSAGFVDDNILNVSKPATTISDRCSSAFVRVNTSALADIHNSAEGPIEILEVRLQFDLIVATNMDSANITIYAIDVGVDPITEIRTNNVTLYNDVISGGIYDRNVTNDETLGLHDVLLNLGAVIDLQNDLASGVREFAIGIAMSDPVRDGSNHVWEIASGNAGSGASIPPRLKIMYATRNSFLNPLSVQVTLNMVTSGAVAT